MSAELVAFILTRGRPEKQFTYRSLKGGGFTGKVVFLLDDEDETRAEYEDKFPGCVRVFNRAAQVGRFDRCDNGLQRGGVVYARAACWSLAKEMGLREFIMVDDDYTDFRYKTDSLGRYCDLLRLRQLNGIFDSLFRWMDSTSIDCLALAQNGDFIGGANGSRAQHLRPWRKMMNVFLCRTDREFAFIGHMNEDVNTYVVEGLRGRLFLTVPNVAVNQVGTQATENGMTQIYLSRGTYVKSFYSVMLAPSCVKVTQIGTIHRRIHHQVSWRHAAPCIIHERHRKAHPSLQA